MYSSPLVDTQLASAVDNFGNVYLSGNVYNNGITSVESITIGPKIISLNYLTDDTLAADVVGGEVLSLTGNGFKPGLKLRIANVLVSSNTVVNSTLVTFTAPARSTGNYLLTVENTDGGVAYYLPGINYSPKPQWNINWSLYEDYETLPVNTQIRVIERDIPNIFEITSGNLPSGVTLYSNGAIRGTMPSVSSNTDFIANISVTDYQNQKNYREFTFRVLADSLSWSYPDANQEYSYIVGDQVSIGIGAGSASGREVTYSATNLPTGLSVTQNPFYGNYEITGTITSVGRRAVTITASLASASSVTRTIYINSAQDTITWEYPYPGQVFEMDDGNPISPITFSTSSVSGRPVSSYSISPLPNYLSVNGNTLSGTIQYNSNNTANVTVQLRAANSIGTIYSINVIFSIRPALDILTGLNEKKVYQNARILNFGRNAGIIKYCSPLVIDGGDTNGNSGNIGTVIVAVWAGLVKGGAGFPTLPVGFQTLYQDSVEIPHYPRDSIANPSAAMCVGVYIRETTDSIDAESNSNYLSFRAPGDPGYAPTNQNASVYEPREAPTVTHYLQAYKLRFTKRISGWTVSRSGSNKAWLSNYPVNNGGFCQSYDGNIPTPTLFVAAEYNGLGQGGQDAEMLSTNPFFAMSTDIQTYYGLNIKIGDRLMPFRNPITQAGSYQICSADYQQSSWYYGSGVDRVYGVNVGVVFLAITFN